MSAADTDGALHRVLFWTIDPDGHLFLYRCQEPPGQDVPICRADNYNELFFSGNSGERWRSIVNTLIYVRCYDRAERVALFIAVIINQRLKGDYFYRAVFFLPVVLGVAVVALIWGMMFDPLNGPVNRLYDALFGYQDMFFGSFTHAFGYIIFVQIWMYMGYSMLIFWPGSNRSLKIYTRRGILTAPTSGSPSVILPSLDRTVLHGEHAVIHHWRHVDL